MNSVEQPPSLPPLRIHLSLQGAELPKVISSGPVRPKVVVVQKPRLPEAAAGQGLGTARVPGSESYTLGRPGIPGKADFGWRIPMWSCPALYDAFLSPPSGSDLSCGLTGLPAFPAPSLFSLTQAFPLIKPLQFHPIPASASPKTRANTLWGFACCFLFVFVSLFLCSYLQAPGCQAGKILAGLSLHGGREIPGFPAWPPLEPNPEVP